MVEEASFNKISDLKLSITLVEHDDQFYQTIDR